MASGSVRDKRYAYKLAAVLGGLALLGFIVWRLTMPATDLWSYCTRLVPGWERMQVTFGTGSQGKVPTLDIGAGRLNDTADAAVIAALSQCVRDKSGVEPAVRWLVSIQSEPLGQLANRWNQEPGLRVRLGPSAEQNDIAVLNNLKIGPTNKAVTKVELLQQWCRQSAACVACDPADIAAEASEVEVRLKPKPATSKQVYQDVAGAAKPDGTYEPWQLIESDRKRYYFVCQGP